MNPTRALASGQQRGIALLTAIFVVILATIAATALVTSAGIALRRTQDLQESEVAWGYAYGAESWVKSILKTDAQQNQTDSLADIWATPISFLPIDQGSIQGGVEDLQGRFNINDLAQTAPPGSTTQFTPVEQLTLLMENIKGVDSFAAAAIAASIKDWVDADSERSAEGAEDQDYLSLTPPYRAANQLMTGAGELLAVHGVTPEIYEALRPYICALPETTTTINVNTASLPVLMSLGKQMDASQLKSFIESRKASPLTTVPDVANGPFKGADSSKIAIKSSYFLLAQQVSVGSARVSLYSVMKRDGTNNPVVISRSTDADY